MDHRNRNRTLRPALALFTAAAVSLALAACGGDPGQANRLLRQTFDGQHQVKSGELGVVLTVTPSGAATLTRPLRLSLVGPFQSLGPGKLPASALSIRVVTNETDAAATITSTGSVGYVTFRGQSYKLPQATFQRLESSFAQLASAPGRGHGSGTLGRLGIHPEHWLSTPQIVGKEAIQGVNTTHIRSRINVAALLADLNTFLQRASSSGVTPAGVLPRSIPGADRRHIASRVKNSTVNVWTGVADKTLRRLAIDLRVPVSGQLSTLLGRSAAIALTMQYANLNQPQTITAPTKLQPYSQFEAKLRMLVEGVGSGLISRAAGSATGG